MDAITPTTDTKWQNWPKIHKLGYILDETGLSASRHRQDIAALRGTGLAVEAFSIANRRKREGGILRRLSGRFSGSTLDDVQDVAPNAFAQTPADTLRLHALAAELSAFAQIEQLTHLHAADAGDAAVVCNLASRLCGIPFSFGFEFGSGQDAYEMQRADRMVEESAFVITGSQAESAALRQALPWHADRFRSLYRAVDLSALTPFEDDYHRRANFVAVGQFVEAHRFSDLIEAVYLLKRMGVAAQATLFGDGPLKSYLKKLISRRGVADRVALRKITDTEYVRAYINRQATAFVMPGIDPQDTFPVELIEAMAMGVPLLLAQTPVSREFVEDGRSGFLLKPDDPVELATRCLMFAKEPGLDRRMGQEARRRAELLFDQRTRAAQLAQWISESSDTEHFSQRQAV